MQLSRIRLLPRVITANVCRMRSSACDTLARLCVRHMLCWLAFPLVSALRSTGSAAVASTADCSAESSHARTSSATAPHLPDADQVDTWPVVRRRISQVPTRSFARDVALDPGGTTMPRIAALHMLRSTMKTVSAPAISSFRGSLPHPTQQLCTLRVRRHRRLTQHSLPGGPLRPYLGRTLHRLIAPALPGAFL